MKLTYLGVLVILIAVIHQKSLVSAADFSGDLTGTNNRITKTGSPHTVSDELIIQPFARLVVEPGTEIRFSPGVGLKVHGELIAEVGLYPTQGLL